jgi:hypothetical protein
MRTALVVVLALTLPATGLAQVAPVAAPPAVEAPLFRWHHRGQVTLRAGLAEGYRFVIRYRDGLGDDPCDDENKKFCIGLSPLMLDTGVGFGVTDGLELEARFRLGLITDFDDSRATQAGFGLRVFTEATARFKFMGAAAMLVDFTANRRRAGGDLDVLVRAEEGFQYEGTSWFGVAFYAGQTFGFLRNFSAIVDLNLAVQFRLPP